MYARISVANKGVIPPEARLFMGEIGGVLTPLGLAFSQPLNRTFA